MQRQYLLEQSKRPFQQMCHIYLQPSIGLLVELNLCINITAFLDCGKCLLQLTETHTRVGLNGTIHVLKIIACAGSGAEKSSKKSI